MVQIKKFVFSPFQENTYVLYNEDKEAWIIDPGCFYEEESQALKEFILEEGLTPVKLLNTHCHLDHIFGNNCLTNHLKQQTKEASAFHK